MAENQSFLRALAPFKRAFLAPASLLLLASTAVVLAPSQQESRSASAVSASPSLVCAASVCTWTFPFTGDYYEWTVPSGLTQVGFDVYGAQGGNGGTSGALRGNGGLGGRVQGKLNVTPGAVLRIYVGGKGTDHSLSGAGGYNGGGSTLATSDDNRRPGAGGGASDIRTGSALSTRVVVAGGGGGASGWMIANGGAGGGLTGQNGQGPFHCNGFGSGGTQLAGGAGASAGCSGGAAGSSGVGGNGRGNSHGGGGGGGGYFGGGGGIVDSGGGGSSFTHASLASEVVHTQGSRTGNGLVVLTMLRPGVSSFAATVTSPSNQSASLTYNLQFSEPVSGLLQSEISLSGTSTGWSITSFSGSGASYVVGLTGSSVTSGTVILTVAQDAVTSDATTQTGPSTATESTTMTIDLDPPGASVTSAPSSPASTMSLTFGLTFTESVTGIIAADFVNAGTAAGCVFAPSASSGSSVNVVVTQCQEGSLQLRLLANTLTDAAGNTGPTSDVTSSVVTLAASSLSVTVATQTVNFGGSWTDSFSQSGLISPDTITVTYSYSGTTNSGVTYGPSSTKPTQAGAYSIIPTITYGGGNSNRYALTATNGSLTINRIAQSTLTVSTTSMTFGQTLSLATTGGSGTGSVSWQVVSGTCTVSGSTLTPGDAGSSCVVKATKAQDNNYTAISSADTTVTIGRASQSALSVSTTSTSYGNDLVLGVLGGSGTGSVSWQVVSGTCTIVGALLSPGDAGSSCVVRATKAQDTNYLSASTSNTTITINKASQSGFNITSASTFTTGSTLTLTASGGQSAGSITWQVTSGVCSVYGSSLTATRGGVSCTVEATRAGNSNYFATSQSMTITVDKIVQSLTFQTSPPSSNLVGGTYTVSVTSDASLAPVVSIANASSQVCTISAGVVSFIAAGTCTINAVQAGNDQIAAASASQQIVVTVVVTTTTTVVPSPINQGTVAPSPSTTVAPGEVIANTVASTTSTTTTTTTTTTIPTLGSGGVTGLDAGEATAIVQGKVVKVSVENVAGELTIRLPNGVAVKVGAPKGVATGAIVNSDGVLVAYSNDQFEVGADGFAAGSTYVVTMHSDPVELSRGEVGESGAVASVVQVPKGVEAGEHTLVIEGVGPNAEVVAVSIGFKVVERSDNTMAAVLAVSIAILLALLGGRPIWRRRKQRLS